MLTVRLAVPADGPAFLELVRALSEFEKLPGPDAAAEGRLLDDAFGPRPRFELHVADLDGRVVGYAASFTTYSTFLARPSLFLEDLFVHPDARRQGAAKALMDRLGERAKALGCGRFEWFVLDWNSGAQTFYDGLGAKRLDAWRLCRVELLP